MGVFRCCSRDSISNPPSKPFLHFSDSNINNLPNPNPSNYKIIKSEKIGKYLITMIKYLDCNNFEGLKILVFENIRIEDLFIQKVIDPHFSDNKKYHFPIARFIPTDIVWKMAKTLCKTLEG